MKNRLLIIGGSSILGLNLGVLFLNQYEVFSFMHNRNVNLNKINTIKPKDFTELRLRKAIKKINPLIIINTAGFTNVELCEKFPNKAKLSNVDLAKIIATICSGFNIKLLHFSTDHITPGSTKFFTENELAVPKNVYSITKHNAEKIIMDVNPDSLIIRTNFICWGTSYKQSFTDWIIYNLRNKNNVTLFEDVYFTPILVNLIFEIIIILLKKNLTGIYNISSSERLSKLEFGLILANNFNLDKGLISAGKLKDRKDLVNRPLDMSLSNKKVIEDTDFNIIDIEKQISIFKTKENDSFIKKIKIL